MPADRNRLTIAAPEAQRVKPAFATRHSPGAIHHARFAIHSNPAYRRTKLPKDTIMNRFNRCVALLLCAGLGHAGTLHAAQTALIGTAQVADVQGMVSVDMAAVSQRAHVLTYLDRPDVVAGLTERGVSADEARSRVAALTDGEVVQLAHNLDTAPAGADGGIVGAIVFIFVLLLVTDILGLTKVFPFTRSAR